MTHTLPNRGFRRAGGKAIRRDRRRAQRNDQSSVCPGGYAGFNNPHAGGGCACWFARFTLDHFARSFAPEMDQYSVAVLDSNGNLILRIGRYGNVDDGVPLIKEGGPANPRLLGGDEVSLFHAAYLGTHTDHRLFISDLGNARLLSVKLDYHVTEKKALKDVKDQKEKEK